MTYLECFPIPVYYLLTTLKSSHIKSEDDVCKLQQILLNWKSGLKCGRCLLMFSSAKVYTWVELTPTMHIAWLAVTLNKPVKKKT